MCLLSYGYLPWSIFSLLLGASTGNLSQSFIDTFSVGSWPWTHPLISEHSIVRPSDQRTLPRTKSCLKFQKWSPYKVKEAFSAPVCARKQTNGPHGIEQGFSTGSCNCCHALSARVVYSPTSPCPTLSASTEPIFKTDCSNSDEAKIWQRQKVSLVVNCLIVKGLNSCFKARLY